MRKRKMINLTEVGADKACSLSKICAYIVAEDISVKISELVEKKRIILTSFSG
jgi:hypothetical protein